MPRGTRERFIAFVYRLRRRPGCEAMDSLVRNAVPGDLEALRALYRRSSLSNEGDRASLLAHPDALVWSDRALHEHRTRVAIRDHHLVGFATTIDIDTGIELEDLFVDPDWMRRGVARDLILESVGFVQGMPVDTLLGSGIRMRRSSKGGLGERRTIPL